MNITERRKAIDHLDHQIVKLLNERMDHALEIGRIKLKAGEAIYAPHREQAVLDRVIRLSQGPIRDDSLRAIYTEIMSSALSMQKKLTVAYLGPEATFTHIAAINRFGSSMHFVPKKSIADVFTEVSKYEAEYGVVPVENSTEGVVTHTLDMFMESMESDLKIVAQIIIPILHCLLSHCKRDAIRRLYVHPQSLGQCRGWLQNNLPHVEIIETSSNARSAELAAEEGNSAAIAGLWTAERYKLPVLEAGIQDKSTNVTRFLVLGRQCGPPTGKDRTSLMFSVKDRVGALYDSLAPFRRYKLNMTKIESRPSKRKAWDYVFFVDCEGHMDDPLVSKAIKSLAKHCSFVKVLGSYPRSQKSRVD